MTRNRWLAVALAVLAAVASWLWWIQPRQVDMAAYAPASSLLYLESNNPLQVVESISQTDAWKIVEHVDGGGSAAGSPWLQSLIRWTGIGPIESVILARAQVAVAVTDLGATETADVLRVKPEAALIVETHTAEWRIRAPVEKGINRLAELTYKTPIFHRTTIDGVEFMEWTAPEGSRQIVATIAGSIAIIGNTRKAVQTCLAVSQGHGPSLRDDPELNRVRSNLGSAQSLSFGYVPASNSARLLSIGLPLLLGRAPANSEFQRLIATGAAKVVGSLGWSSRPYLTGIEDRFLISLQPSIAARLKPSFAPLKTSSAMEQNLPSDVQSVTFYKFENPLTAWQGLKGAVSSEVDALSAIFFSSVLKSALLSFGIDDPEAFLATVDAEILTLRADPNAERSILIARVRDQTRLRTLLAKTMRTKRVMNQDNPVDMMEDSQGEFAVAFTNDLVVLGSPTDVRHYTDAMRTRTQVVDPAFIKKMSFFASASGSSSIVTYLNDSDRVRSFIAAVIAAKRVGPLAENRMDEMLLSLPYSATETSLGESGLERTTRSPLGQFSTLLPLLIPDPGAP